MKTEFRKCLERSFNSLFLESNDAVLFLYIKEIENDFDLFKLE